VSSYRTLLNRSPKIMAFDTCVKGDAPPQISILLPTCNRPKLLENCLAALSRQETKYMFEIIVVNNAPAHAGITDVVAQFPLARTITEKRPGLSYARNAGIRAARGDILVFTDDDTLAAPDWLENLAAPFFSRAEITAVTGQTLPLKLETEAEILFEAYGGLWCGATRSEFNKEWLSSRRLYLPLWVIGTTANAAFRACIFRDPAVSLLDERLGAGSPVGAWEDLYLFYRILRAGGVIVYLPNARLRHAHREHLHDLGGQLKAYRRGEVAFCILSLLREREWRSLLHLCLWIPYWRTTQLAGELLRRIRGQRRFRLRLVLKEWFAYLEGVPALILSHQQVQRWAKESSNAVASTEIARNLGPS
jgi:O-antigen biosynthesis protein